MDLRIIDTVPADSLEVGDMVSVNGEDVEILNIEPTEDGVSLRGFSHTTGDTDNYPLGFDTLVDILGV